MQAAYRFIKSYTSYFFMREKIDYEGEDPDHENNYYKPLLHHFYLVYLFT